MTPAPPQKEYVSDSITEPTELATLIANELKDHWLVFSNPVDLENVTMEIENIIRSRPAPSLNENQIRTKEIRGEVNKVRQEQHDTALITETRNATIQEIIDYISPDLTTGNVVAYLRSLRTPTNTTEFPFTPHEFFYHDSFRIFHSPHQSVFCFSHLHSAI